MPRASLTFVLTCICLVPSAAFAAPLCDNANVKNAKQWVDIAIHKDGSVAWNGGGVTLAQLHGYLQDEVALSWSKGPIVHNYIHVESETPAQLAQARSIMTEAEKMGAVFPECQSISTN